MLWHLGSIRMQLLHVLDIIYNFNNICRRLADPLHAPPPRLGRNLFAHYLKQELLLFLCLVTRNHHHRHETCGAAPPVRQGWGRVGHAHLSSLKMVGAEISTAAVVADAGYIYACATARPKALQVSRPAALHFCLTHFLLCSVLIMA